MIQPLKNIASIQFGVYDKPEPIGDVLYLQGSNFNSAFPKTFVSKDKVSPNHLLKDGDILIAAKGFRNTAIRYSASLGPAVASSMFFVLKPDTSKVIPDYVTLFLNDMKTQNLLRSLSGTTTVPTISKKDLAEIQIPLPSISQQMKIVSVMQQWQEEKKLTQRLIEKKDVFYSSLFNQLIQK
jgi:restriction endonuclease S subunit